MKGSIFVHANGDRIAITRLTMDASGLDSPSGEFDTIQLPVAPSGVGQRVRTMLELPRMQVPDDTELRQRKYAVVARSLGLDGEDLLKVSPHLLISAMPSEILIARIARQTPRSKLRIAGFAKLSIDVADDVLGQMVLTALGIGQAD